MGKFINPLSSIEAIQDLLDYIYQSKANPSIVSRFYIRTEKTTQPIQKYVNISTSPSSKAYFQNDACSLTFDDIKHEENPEIIKTYYTALNDNNKKRTSFYLIAVVALFFSTYVLPPFVSGWLSLLVVIPAAFDIINQRRFMRKTYLPYLKTHGFLDKQLQNVLVLKSPTKLSHNIIHDLEQFGALQFLSEIDSAFNYQLTTLEQRNTIMNYIRNKDINNIEIFSTVKKKY